VLEGMSEIVLTLFEAALGTDAGPYYLKSCLHFDGTELYDELREKLAGRIIEMCREYVRQSETLKATPQTGSETIYRRRTTKDDELDVNKTLAAQFNHLRISDNEHHPVYFRINGHKYILKIYHALPNSPCHREVQS